MIIAVSHRSRIKAARLTTYIYVYIIVLSIVFINDDARNSRLRPGGRLLRKWEREREREREREQQCHNCTTKVHDLQKPHLLLRICCKLTLYSNVEFPNFPGGSAPEPYFKFKGGWRGRDKLPYFTLHRAAKMSRPALSECFSLCFYFKWLPS